MADEAALIRQATSHACLPCGYLASLFDAVARDDGDAARRAMRTVFGADGVWDFFVQAERWWLAARHLIDPVGRPAAPVPDLSTARFKKVCVPSSRRSATEAAVAAPVELLLVLASAHLSEGWIETEEMFPVKKSGGRKPEPDETRPRVVLSESYDWDLLRRLFDGRDGTHYRVLQQAVHAEREAAAGAARRDLFNALRPATVGTDTPHVPGAESPRLQPLDEASGDEDEPPDDEEPRPDGPEAETGIFWYNNEPHPMKPALVAKLIPAVWNTRHRRLPVCDLYGPGKVWADEPGPTAIPSAVSECNAFFRDLRPGPGGPPYRMSKPRYLKHVEIVEETTN